MVYRIEIFPETELAINTAVRSHESRKKGTGSDLWVEIGAYSTANWFLRTFGDG